MPSTNQCFAGHHWKWLFPCKKKNIEQDVKHGTINQHVIISRSQLSTYYGFDIDRTKQFNYSAII